jgi:glycosyltransferase involved in cell wall biosynthesis
MGRTEELVRLFASLGEQSLRDFEVIVVDQNPDERLCPIVEAWRSHLDIQHLRSEPGLSRSRNKGLTVASGKLIAFPDDDCWYPNETLQRVKVWFEGHSKFDILSGCARTDEGELTSSRWMPASSEIHSRNVYRTGISFTLFFRASAIHSVQGFDEQLGLGAGTRFGSGEESDCVFRLLARGSRGWFDRDLTIHHPNKTHDFSAKARIRAHSYGVGFGYLLRRHKLPLLHSLYLCARPAGGCLLALIRRRPGADIYWATFRGRLEGYWGGMTECEERS